jgi:hypothetical protein
MGFEAGMFTEQVNKAAEDVRERAVEVDDCAQLVQAWLDGEKANSFVF